MALTKEKIKLLADAAKLLNVSIAGKHDSSTLLFPEVMTWRDLRAVINSAAVEAELQENVVLADELLADAANTFAAFHNAAAAVEVNPPSEEQVESFKQNLRGLHELVQQDQEFEDVAKFADALADLIESTQG